MTEIEWATPPPGKGTKERSRELSEFANARRNSDGEYRVYVRYIGGES